MVYMLMMMALICCRTFHPEHMGIGGGDGKEVKTSIHIVPDNKSTVSHQIRVSVGRQLPNGH